jgi:hypothetical protein
VKAWPFCEGWVASTLKRHGDLRLAEIGEYGAQEYFSPNSKIRHILRYEPVETVLRALRDALTKNHDWRDLSALEI